MFPTPPLSLCLPLLAVLLVDFHGLLSSGRQNSSSGCLISSIEVAYEVVLGAWNWANHEILLQQWLLLNSRLSFCFFFFLGPRCWLGFGLVCLACLCPFVFGTLII
ncbi:hypothetical protein DVH24_038943 [Malus domestica]|uniref:Secreted protein n=1 Tax=Malus domestica TaxID=3750 RepID=A0A498K8R1_MALDO|nr:hypothetical protein DVH24_038943 [Malus domestica]